MADEEDKSEDKSEDKDENEDQDIKGNDPISLDEVKDFVSSDDEEYDETKDYQRQAYLQWVKLGGNKKENAKE